jgi:uncharacterized protein YoxC
MKKFLKKLLLCVAAAAVAFGLTFAPVVVSAEGVSGPLENSTETSENSTDSAMVEEELKTGEAVENSGNETEEEITLDDLLTIVGQIAEKEGVGEWQETMDNIRLAISAKKLDVVIVVEFIKLGLISAYVLGKVIKGIKKWYQAKKNPSTVEEDVQSIKQSSATQTKAVNEQTKAIKELTQADEHVAEQVEQENEKLKDLASAQVGMNEAIRCIIRGVGMSGAIKEEAYRALNNSNESCDKVIK